MTDTVRRLLLVAVLAIGGALAGASGGLAQAAAESAVQPGPAPVETKSARSKLDAFKLELDQKEAALGGGRELSDPELQLLRQQIDPIAASIRELVGGLLPRVEAAKARLEQLGPKPKENAAEESADVAKERAERESAFADFDETHRLGRSLLVQAEQLASQIGERRRSGFARALFQRNTGLLSPELWLGVLQTLPREVMAVRTVFEDWLRRIERRAGFGPLLLVGLAFGMAIALYAGRRHIAPRLVTRDPAALDASRRKRLLAALAVFLLGAVPAAAGSLAVYAALDAVDMLTPSIEPVAAALLTALAFVAMVRALADAILAPGNASWRLVSWSDAAAARLAGFAVVLVSLIAVGKVLETLNRAVAAALPITIAIKGVFALAAALVLAELLRRFASTAVQEEACLGPYVPTQSDIGGPARVLGWAAVVAVIVSVAAGYIALASFLVDQIVWISLLLGLLLLAIALADELIGGTLRDQTRVATALQANTGLRRRSLEQIAVLASGTARVVLILAAVMLALAPWGVESVDVIPSLSAAVFGFKIGDVTISLSALAIAGLIFTLGFGATRIVQRWLDTAFLPATELDAGLRNSIRTAFGYFGVVVAGAVAFSYLGLSLDRLTIVAGALSVGIGFGLQSIVNNFVSGLILLWERPIRVGDLVVVGDGEGYVRRINVRATEIETFDRATIIVPNSSLVSGVVRNRVRSSRTGRVVVSVPVPRDTDPDAIAALVSSCALAHREVLSEPGPRVLFKKIGEASIEFDLVCFVDEIESASRVASELHFAIFRCLREAYPSRPAATPKVSIDGLDRFQEAILTAVSRGTDPVSPNPAGGPALPQPPVPILAPRPAIRRPKHKPA